MVHMMQSTRTAAVADARRAISEYDDAQAWLQARPILTTPLYAEVWVVDRERSQVLLVHHRIRGWVPPGGTVEPGEVPRQAAIRELKEETGISATLEAAPTAVAVRSFRADWEPTLSLSYSTSVDRKTSLSSEIDQPARWVPLGVHWDSVFADDRRRIQTYVRGGSNTH